MEGIAQGSASGECAMTADEPVSRHFVSQRLKLHYADWGNAGAPPLILVHGQRDHCRSWDWVARTFRHHFHVVAPDLRGHGDSAWSGGNYPMSTYVLDLARFLDHLGTGQATIIGHSLGGNIAVRFAGTFPELVTRLVCIEGLGRPPAKQAERDSRTIDERLRLWIAEQGTLLARRPRRYPTFEAAAQHMQAANRHLSPDQAHHLALHGARRNEDGSWSWKFDPLVRSSLPEDLTSDEIRFLWSRVSAPTLLVYGRDSWASNPAEDGRLAHPGESLAVDAIILEFEVKDSA